MAQAPAQPTIEEQLRKAITLATAKSLKEIVKSKNITDIDQYRYILNEVPNVTLLMLAAQRANTQAVKALLEMGADVNAVDDDNRNAWFHLIGIGYVHGLELFGRLGEGDDTQEETIRKFIDRVAKVNPFFIANPSDVNLQDISNGDTMLMKLAKAGDPDIIDIDDPTVNDILGTNNVDISLRNKQGKDLLIVCLDAENNTILYIVLENLMTRIDTSALLNDLQRYPSGILNYALENKLATPQIIRTLLQAGANANQASPVSGNLPLHLAIQQKEFDIVRVLLESTVNAVDVNAVDGNGRTPLMMCVTEGHIRIAELLLSAAPNVNATVTGNVTALHHLVSSGAPVRIIQMLLDAGADKTLKTAAGETPLDIAKRLGFDRYFELLSLEEPATELWKGYTQDDAEFFNRILADIDKPEPEQRSIADISICPFCLQHADRTEACKYMTHKCPPQARHPRLYDLYKNPEGFVYWCTVCGRHCFGHKHFALSDSRETTRSELLDAQEGAQVFVNSSCPLEGGGGPDEKIRRVDGLLRYVCEVQDDVDKRSAREVRTELIEEAWKAAGTRAPKTVQQIRTAKKFNIPCGLPIVQVAPPAPPPSAPDVPNINDMPVRHENEECAVEMEECDVVYEFIHTQPDGRKFNHNGKKLGKNAIRDMIKNSGGQEDVCPIGEGCRGKLHPAEIQEIFAEDPEFYENYKARFNEMNRAAGGKRRKTSRRRTYRAKKYRGGSKTGTPIMSEMSGESEARCALPAKGAGRKTRRQKKRRGLFSSRA